MNESYYIGVLIGSIPSVMKMSMSELRSRLNDPDKYYKLNTKAGRSEFFRLLRKLEKAEKTLWEKTETYAKDNIMYKKNKNYIFDCCTTSHPFVDGGYYCRYKKMKIIPS